MPILGFGDRFSILLDPVGRLASLAHFVGFLLSVGFLVVLELGPYLFSGLVHNEPVQFNSFDFWFRRTALSLDGLLLGGLLFGILFRTGLSASGFGAFRRLDLFS